MPSKAEIKVDDVWSSSRSNDTRALELAAGTHAAFEQHLRDCRDRYLATESSIRDVREAIEDNRRDRVESTRQLYGFLWKVTGALVALLLFIVGYLIDKGGLPGVHG